MAGRYWVESIRNVTMTDREYLLCVARDNGLVEHLGQPEVLRFATRAEAVQKLTDLLAEET